MIFAMVLVFFLFGVAIADDSLKPVWSIPAFLPLLQEWKDCIAVEMINDPVLGDGPPETCDITNTEIVPMRLQKMLAPGCEILDLHMYQEAF